MHEPLSDPPRDARGQAAVMFIALLSVTLMLAMLTRLILGMFNFMSVVYIFLVLGVSVCFSIMGLVYYFYPSLPTVKEIFKPIDIALLAGFFTSFYLHIICFADSHSKTGAFPLFALVADTQEQAIRISQCFSIILIVLAGIFWLGIAVRGVLRQRTELQHQRAKLQRQLHTAKESGHRQI